MQPSLRCPKVIPSVACVKRLRQIVASTRSFSTTAPQHARGTRARRQFYAWMATKGVSFRNPIPDSTNYLNAYASTGELKRVLVARKEAQKQEKLKEAAEAAGRPYRAPEQEIRHKETPDEAAPTTLSRWKAEREAKRLERLVGTKKTNLEADGVGGPKPMVSSLAARADSTLSDADAQEPAQAELPPERATDLMPFPLNPTFKSEPVLSEKFRQKIWEAIIIEGQTVREASARFNVEMSRIGATVRLMEIQKEWERVVCSSFLMFSPAFMMIL